MKEKLIARKYGALLSLGITFFIFLDVLMVDYILPRYSFRNPIVKTEIISPLSNEIEPTIEPQEPTALPIEKVQVEVKEEISEASEDVRIARYIASKDWDYETAIKIAKSENAWNERGYFDCSKDGGQNDNGTYDHGIWQINDIHIISGEITLEDTYDCYKATDFAFKLHQRRLARGQDPFIDWSAYNNGRYLNHVAIKI